MENTLYTDGHGIKVTTSEFVTRSASYKIAGIINARVNLLKATLTPAVLLIILGIGGLVAAFFHLFSNTGMEPLYIAGYMITVNRLAGLLGLILFVTGIVWCAMLRDRYAVHIETAEGEKEPVVSTRKQYVQQIVSAIRKALNIGRR